VKKFIVYDDVILCYIRKLPFRSDSFDVAVATEVIECARKGEGFQFVEDLKRITKGRILLTNPARGRGVRDEKPSLGREYLHYLSAWDVEDFKKTSFNVRGVGFRFLRLSSRMRYIPTCLAILFTPISFYVPKFSGFLIA